MRYISTRGETPELEFKETVLTGLAPDGGLILPRTIPDVRAKLGAWKGLGFVELAAEVMSLYVDDIPRRDLEELLARSYSGFDHPAVTPLVKLSGITMLELFHGPTLAFKDVALQFLGNLFEHILAERTGRMNVLVATSGDTGSAAIAAARGRRGLRIFVLYPKGRVSPLQELQMTTIVDDDVHCIAVDGSFDDCQALMKALFADVELKRRLALGAMNSVNWARLLAQIVYYVYASLAVGSGVTFSVPTGNFGDIFAGYLALEMGLPIERLVCATNENDILSVFFNTGVYRRGPVRHTITPSMDIQVASNLERFLYLRLGRDSARVRDFMTTFVRAGEARLEDGPVHPSFCATAVGTAEALATIRAVYEQDGYLLDPHSAVGVAAAKRLAGDGPVVCLATAHPAKFPDAVNRAVGEPLARHAALDLLAGRPARRVELPARDEAIRDYLETHALA